MVSETFQPVAFSLAWQNWLRRPARLVALASIALLLVVLSAFRWSPSVASPQAPRTSAVIATEPASDAPSRFDPAWRTPPAVPPDRLGWVPETHWLEYDFSGSLAPRIYRAGAVRLKISGEADDTLPSAVMVTQHVTISAPGMRAHELVGEPQPAAQRLRLAVIKLELGDQVPAVLIQGYMGGFQCCNHVLVAVPQGREWRTVDLGEDWHGVSIPYPRDLDGDGRPELLFPDTLTAFHFTKQEYDVPPPVVINIIGGKAINVSRDPRFRSLFLAEMEKAERLCRDPDPPTSAGACPGFVADAARAGRLNEAWRVMMNVHKEDPDYELPKRCEDGLVGFCDKGTAFASYPLALEALLKQGGYIAKDWRPPLQG